MTEKMDNATEQKKGGSASESSTNAGKPTASAPPINDKDPLTDTERKTLIQHEKIISEGLSKFLDVANALRVIRVKKLYRETGWNFEEYCEHRFDISRQMGARWVKSAELAEKIQPYQGLLPSRESQFRELAIAAPDKRQEAWEKSVEEAGGKEPTAEIIRKHSESLRRTKTPRSQKKSTDKNPSGDVSTANMEKDSDKALAQADAVITFLRGKAAKALDKTRKRDWKRVLDDIERYRKTVGI